MSFWNTEEDLVRIKETLPTSHHLENGAESKALSSDGHCFSNNICLDSVHLIAKENNIYSFYWVFDESSTDFKNLSQWKLGAIFKPADRNDFIDSTLRKKGIKTIGVLTKPFLHEDNVVMVLEDIELIPKNYEYIKFYVYDYTDKVDLDYWIIEDLDLNKL